MTATVGDLGRMLELYSASNEVTFDVKTTHRSDRSGVFVRVALCVRGVELLNMEFDNREENAVSTPQDTAKEQGEQEEHPPMLGGLPEPAHDDMACYNGQCICGRLADATAKEMP